jgi:hypothetical protein
MLRTPIHRPVAVVVTQIPQLTRPYRSTAPPTTNQAGRHLRRPNLPQPLMLRPIAALRRRQRMGAVPPTLRRPAPGAIPMLRILYRQPATPTPLSAVNTHFVSPSSQRRSTSWPARRSADRSRPAGASLRAKRTASAFNSSDGRPPPAARASLTAFSTPLRAARRAALRAANRSFNDFTTNPRPFPTSEGFRSGREENVSGPSCGPSQGFAWPYPLWCYLIQTHPPR